MDNFEHFIYRQRDKKLDCVEDVNNCDKDKEITVLTNVGLILFDRKI